MKKLLVLVLALSAVVALSACKPDDDAEEVVFNWNIGADPRTLDPGLNGASDGGDVINNTFEGLVREKNGEVLPGMAEDWVVSTDGLTVTFNIREDAMWSDGTALDADDFVRSWLRAMNPNNASEYSWIWHYTNVVGANDFVDAYRAYDEDAYEAMEEAFEADDTQPEPEKVYTETEAQFEARLETLSAAVGIESADGGAQLVIDLSAPTNWFVSLMAFYHFMPVPEGATIEGEGAWAKDADLSVSNGPFTLSEYTVGEGLELVKNENYWNADEVGIDKVNGFFIDQATTAYAKFEADELDFLPSVPTAEIPGLMVASDEFYVFPLLGTYYVNFNLSGCDLGGARDVGDRDNTIWCNENLRQALALSLDRDAITEALAAGQVPAGGFIPPGFADADGEDFYDNSKNDSEIVTDDSTYAAAVTYFETAADELYPEAADTAAAVLLLQAELETKSYHHNTSESHAQVAALMQGMWEENLGFTIEVTNEEWALFQATRTDGDFDLARGGWLTDFMDPSGMLGIFTQGNAYNDADYNSAAFETAIADAQTATTAADHFAALYTAHEVFMQDMPVIPIYHYNDTYLVSGRLEGWSRSVLGTVDFSTATIVAE